MVASNPPTGPYSEGRRTSRLRPRHGFTSREVVRIRRMRKAGADSAEIAAAMDAMEWRVNIVLAALRTRRPDPDRHTVNVGDDAYRFIMDEKQGREAVWRTMDRILTELQDLRRRSPPS